MNAVNSKTQGIQGTTISTLRVRSGQEEYRFMALPLDEFDIILGIEFFVQAKPMAMPHLRGFMIVREKSPSFVPVEGQVIKKPLMQSASQFKSGIKKGETTMISALVEIKPDQVVEVPNLVTEILDEFRDVMSMKLPKVLSLRRAIDHRIELVLGTRP